MDISNKDQLLKKAVKTAIIAYIPLLAIAPVFAQSTEQNLLQTANIQYQHANPRACVQTLNSLSQLIGDISYDRLLGLCAQAAGFNNQALLAYNRIISQQEQNAEMRLERARVLYNLNLFTEARSEFNWLLAKNPPPSAKAVIQNYLASINNKISKVKPYSRLKISTSLGYDDNVNSATELDDFLGFTLNENSRASSSNYAGINLQASHQFKVSPNLGLKVSTSLGRKHYPDAEFVDQELITVGVGLSKVFTSSSVNLDLLAYRQAVDSEFNSRGAFLRTSYRKKYSPSLANTTHVTAGALRYSDSLAVKDINQYTIGTGFTLIPTRLPQDSFTLDLSLGHDYPLFTDSNYEASFASVKLFHRHNFKSNLRSRSVLEYKKYSYDNPFFSLSISDDRDDDATSASFALDWDINKQFKLSPSFAYRDNNSNVDLFSYNRWYAEINASYQWIW